MDVTTETGFVNRTERELPVEGFFDIAPYRHYDVMPDGQRFLVVFPSGQEGPTVLNPQINTVLNWTSELLERVP